MADITPNVPAGANPLRPGDSGKVQPKKETVRINLPPKPTAAPTIKLPTLPAKATGAPTPAPAAAPAGAPRPPGAAPKPPTPPAAGAPGTRIAGGAAAPAARSTPAAPASASATAGKRPAAMPMASALSTMDKVLAIAVAVIGVGALAIVLFCAFYLPDHYQPGS